MHGEAHLQSPPSNFYKQYMESHMGWVRVNLVIQSFAGSQEAHGNRTAMSDQSKFAHFISRFLLTSFTSASLNKIYDKRKRNIRSSSIIFGIIHRVDYCKCKTTVAVGPAVPGNNTRSAASAVH